MKQLRILRIILAILFLGASVGALIMGSEAHAVAKVAERSQILLSAFSITAGATAVWLLLTLLFGRFYCSTVCPVGTISDLAIRCRKFIPGLRHKTFRYRHPSRFSIHILWIYAACLIIGIVCVPFMIEPWNIMRNITSALNPSSIQTTWLTIGLGSLTGIIGGILGLLLIIILSLLRGREFCTSFCPVGIGLGYLSNHALYHIEIDRDRCSSCGLCEEICRSQCIKVVSRYVDNSRCVRCLDCLAKCPDNAIHLQINRNRPATPLLMRTKKRSNT